MRIDLRGVDASLLAPLAVGAALLFMLDPSAVGRGRAVRREGRAVSARRYAPPRRLWQELRHRASRWRARMHNTDERADDGVITARVRTALGRATSHRGSIAVATVDGIVVLNGPVLARDHGAVLHAAETTRGVAQVVDHMSQHEDAANIPSLQGEGSEPSPMRSHAIGPLLAICASAVLLSLAIARRSQKLSSRRTTVTASDGFSNSGGIS